ncbi:MAG TPA: carboxypeptidase-like regulatory domain-containing protein, partial [Chroococcales cyanobacterium]
MSLAGNEKARETARITGKVTDLTGVQGIEQADILLIKEGAVHKRVAVKTTSTGEFSAQDLEPGQWSITVTAPNMLSDTRRIDLVGSEIKVLNFSLESLEAEEILRITGKRTLIHPEKIGSTTNVNHDTVYQYGSGNDLHRLIESTPGVITDTIGNIIVRGEHNAINYQLDGVYLPEAAGVLQQSNFVTPRSLQSMQVDIGGYQASDGGGPMGAFTRLKSLPITTTPTFKIGQQMGGPLAGNVYFNTSGALSPD